MQIRGIGGLLIAVLIVASSSCSTDVPDQMDAERAEDGGDGEAHWSYAGDTGAESWGRLDPAFATCDTGVQQSPVDLAGAIRAGGDGPEVQWRPTGAQVLNNGHTIQVDMAEGSSITLEGRRFSLLQFHFHLPSEHLVDGASSPMEAHFVHRADEGDLAVVGVFMDIGEAHTAIQSIWEAIPDIGESPSALAGLDPNAFLPEGDGHFRYAGSLTTPPCSEVVSWVVMTESIDVSRAQVDAFAAMYPMNARPVEPLHRRFILLRQ